MDRRHVDVYFHLKNELTQIAREAREQARNYRGFNVGCAILSYNGMGYQIYRGTNAMPVKGQTKVCAEQSAVCNLLLDDGCNFIVAIVVCGEAQSDGESEVVSPTLHPCGNCRRFLQGFPEVLPGTIICTAGVSNDDPTEERSFEELLKLHKIHHIK